MYTKHEAFQPPEDPATTIWRYVDFSKFVSLLEKQALFFARADLLDDQFEGFWPAESLHGRKHVVFEFKGLVDMMPKHTAINCWHMSEYESAALWKIYSRSGEGIALRSTYKRLAEAFSSDFEEPVFVGVVKYIDFTRDQVPGDHPLASFLCKRRSFEHERELRAVIHRLVTPELEAQLSGRYRGPGRVQQIGTGIYVPVDLRVLLERIYVSPESPTWFFELVEAVIRRYELELPVVKSDLATGRVGSVY